MTTKAFKQDKIEAMKENFSKAKVAVVTEYRGMSVEEITKLRRNLQKENSDYMVTKNTLAKVASKGTRFEILSDALKGPVAIAFGYGDEVAPAKIITKFIKDSKKGEIIGAALDGKFLDAKETQVLASLPSKEELYAKMLGSINSPATGIVGAVNAVMSGLVRAMDQVAKKKTA